MNSDSQSGQTREVTYLSVTVSPEGLAEMRGARRAVFVPRKHVLAIEVRFGSQSDRPLAQAILGSILAALGLTGLVMLVGGGIATIRWAVGALFLAVVGLWLLWEVAKRRYYLLVISANDRRKLIFAGAVQKSEMSAFLRNATQLGYTFKHCTNGQEFI